MQCCQAGAGLSGWSQNRKIEAASDSARQIQPVVLSNECCEEFLEKLYGTVYMVKPKMNKVFIYFFFSEENDVTGEI